MASSIIQNAQGKWKLSLKHGGKGGITIPAKFTYSGTEIEFGITNNFPSTPIDTGWKTELGEPIDFYNKVDRVYTPYIDGNKRYIVHVPESIAIIPYDGGGGGGGDEPEPVPVVQPYLGIRLNKNKVEATGGGVVLIIESNVSWEITDNSGILSYTVTSGTDDKRVTISVPTYTNEASDRTFIITVRGSGLTKNVSLTQSKAEHEDEGGEDEGDDSGTTKEVGLTIYIRYIQNSTGTWKARYWLQDILPDGIDVPLKIMNNAGDVQYVMAGKDVRETDNIVNGTTSELGYVTRFYASFENFTYDGVTFVCDEENRVATSCNVYSTEYGEGYWVAGKKSPGTKYSSRLDYRVMYGCLRDLSDGVFVVDDDGNMTGRTINEKSYFVEGTSAYTYFSRYKKENMVRKFMVDESENFSLGFFIDIFTQAHPTQDLDVIIYDSEMNDITNYFKKVSAVFNVRPPMTYDTNMKKGYLYVLKDGHTIEPGTYQIAIR